MRKRLVQIAPWLGAAAIVIFETAPRWARGIKL
jgi:hypothetical protein